MNLGLTNILNQYYLNNLYSQENMLSSSMLGNIAGLSFSDIWKEKYLQATKETSDIIVIPESLQEKMDADTDYAKEILTKVQTWKEAVERQNGKNYCIRLDENGEVVNATITKNDGTANSETTSSTASGNNVQKAGRRISENREIQERYQWKLRERAIDRML